MKKIIVILSILVLSISLVGCGVATTDNNNEINVGVAFYPMKDILTLIKDDVKEAGYDLVINEFADYQAPNNLLKNKELDANMIQHDYFLQSFNKANNSDLVTIQPIYHATFALYSKDYKTIEEIPNDASITLPDDSTNLSRALYLLGQAGLLTFKDNKTTELTLDDIESNPKNLILDDQVPLTSLAQRYTETGLAIMYPTYAKSLELVGDDQRLYVEKQDYVTEGYAISLVARNDNKDSEKIKVLIEHLTSDKVRQFLIDEYNWASSPAF
ncbi:MetQ/NlpA family ABC transporter substrate-binding protein [Tissierella sp.]|uniref:MetQ/NlpA family ABC transporter substrate-binding protein n=1 Tax=Tissierella sp. TaxID=41274 RepID=UPI002861A755|nr:MetQ/NlpA family ABC transporter substrate-binding protein [Tissierella sp.]MDR7855231.1 MetQ/NlpA family ABC transporter substrate-binding protein [Tissierella sp.]